MSKKCILCGNDSFELVHNKFRGDIDREALKCTNCSLVFSSKIFEAKQEELDSFYESEYKDTYFDEYKRDIKNNFNSQLSYQYIRKDRIKDIIKESNSLLEVGCGPGYFLYVCKDEISDLNAIEKNFSERKFVNEELNIKCHEDISEIKDKKFDIIVMYQLLEHVANPIEFLKEYTNLLNKNGYLVIEVPSIFDAIVSFYKSKSFMDFYFQDPHLYYFSMDTLKLLFSKLNNLELVSIDTYQETSFINHYNWAVYGKRSPMRAVANSDDFPIDIKESECKSELQELYKNFNIEYKKILNSYGYGDRILAVVKKID